MNSASLEQLFTVPLLCSHDANSGGTSSTSTASGCRVVASHRRSMCVMTCSFQPDKKRVMEMLSMDENPKSSHLVSKSLWRHEFKANVCIVAVLPVEAHDAFIMVIRNKAHSLYAAFIDIQGREVNEFDLPKMNPHGIASQICASDVDQFRKDLLVAGPQGMVTSYSIRQTGPTKDQKHFQLIFRRRNKLPIENNQGLRPMKLCTQDVSSLTIILFENDGIACVDSATLDLLWHIEPFLFVMPPVDLWVDKFGSDFVVQCRHRTNVGQEMLEYWVPPTNFQQCDNNQFSRTSLPVSEPVVDAVLETFATSVSGNGKAANSAHNMSEVYILVVTRNDSVYLWRPIGLERRTTVLECKLQLNLPDLPPIGPNDILLKNGSLDTVTRNGCSFFTGILPLCGAPISIAIAVGPLIVVASVHQPAPVDLAYQSLASSILIEQSETALYKQASVGASAFASKFGHLTNFLQMTGQPSAGNNEIDAKQSANSSTVHDESKVHSPPNSHISLHVNMSDSLPSTFAQSKPTRGFSGPIDDELYLRSGANTADGPSGAEQHQDDLNSISDELHSPSFHSVDDTVGGQHSHPAQHTSMALSPLSVMNIRPSRPALRQHPSTFFFTPLIMFGNTKSAQSSQGDSGILRLVNPPSLALLDHGVFDDRSYVTNSADNDPCIYQFTRKKLVNRLIQDTASKTTASENSVEVRHYSIAYRSNLLGVATSLKEALVYNVDSTVLGSSSGTHVGQPVRIDLDVRALASISSMLLADISLVIPVIKGTSKSSKQEIMSLQSQTEVIGAQFLYAVGDSDGILHFAVINKEAVVSQGKFTAHSDSPICRILSTGDAVKPLWRLMMAKVGTTWEGEATAGSAIVTLSEAGEVRVWQPTFVLSDTLKKPETVVVRAIKPEQVLSVSTIQWRLVGVFTGRVVQLTSHVRSLTANTQIMAGAISSSVKSMVLDPTCATLIVGNGDGSLDQWCIPGLIGTQEPNGKSVRVLHTSTEPVWTIKPPNLLAVSDARVWTHIPDSSIQDTVANETTMGTSAGFALYCRVPHGAKSTLAFTRQQLRHHAENASMVTCHSPQGNWAKLSPSSSVVLWRFMVSSALDTSSQPTVAPVSYFLNPVACRRIEFSGIASGGLCYCVSPFGVMSAEDEHWKVDVLVNGVVTTAMEGSKISVFSSVDGVVDGKEEFAALETSSGANPHGHQAAIVSAIREGLSAMPVVCRITRPHRVMAALTQKLPTGIKSWDILDKWSELIQQHLDEADAHAALIRSNAQVLESVPVTKPALLVSEYNVEIEPQIPEEVMERFRSSPDGKQKLDYEGIRIASRYAETVLQQLKESKRLHERVVVDHGEAALETYSMDDESSLASEETLDEGFVLSTDVKDGKKTKVNINISTSVSTWEEVQRLAMRLAPNSVDPMHPPFSPQPMLSSRVGTPSMPWAMLPPSPKNADSYEGLEVTSHRSANSRKDRYFNVGAAINTSSFEPISAVDHNENVDKEQDKNLDIDDPNFIAPKANKSMQLRQAMQNELKTRLDRTEKQRTTKVTYTSKVTPITAAQPANMGKNKAPVAAHYAGASMFTMPKNLFETKLQQSQNKVVVGDNAFVPHRSASPSRDVPGREAQFVQNTAHSLPLNDDSTAGPQFDDSFMSSTFMIEESGFGTARSSVIASAAEPINGNVGNNEIGKQMELEEKIDHLPIDMEANANASASLSHSLDGSRASRTSKTKNDKTVKLSKVLKKSGNSVGSKSLSLSLGGADDEMTAVPTTYFDRSAAPVAKAKKYPAVKRLISKRRAKSPDNKMSKEKEKELLAVVKEPLLEALADDRQSDLASILGSLSTTDYNCFSGLEEDNQSMYIDNALESYDDAKINGIPKDILAQMASRLLKVVKSAKQMLADKMAAKLRRRKPLKVSSSVGQIFDKHAEIVIQSAATGQVVVLVLNADAVSASSQQPTATYITPPSGEITSSIGSDRNEPTSIVEPLALAFTCLTSRDFEGLKHIPGFVCFVLEDVVAQELNKVSLKPLRFSTSYKCYSFVFEDSINSFLDGNSVASRGSSVVLSAESSVTATSENALSNPSSKPSTAGNMGIGDFLPMAEDTFKATEMRFTTEAEGLEIDWNHMTEGMREAEIRSLLRISQLFRGTLPPGLVLPTEEEIQSRSLGTQLGRAALRKWDDFVEWWTARKNHVRSSFYYLETLFLLQQVPIAPSSTESDPMPLQHLHVLKQAQEQGVLAEDEVVKLKLLASTITIPVYWSNLSSEGPPTHIGTVLDCPSYLRFRSWYRAGAALDGSNLQQEEELSIAAAVAAAAAALFGTEVPGNGPDDTNTKKSYVSLRESVAAKRGRKSSIATSFNNRKESSSKSFTALSSAPTLSPAVMQRLAERTAFLMERMQAVEHAKLAVVSLVDHLKFTEKAKLVPEDMEKRRSKLKAEDLAAIMGSLKLRQLCLTHNLIDEDTKLDSVKFSISTGYNLLYVAGVHMFSAINMEAYKPDEPPNLDGMPIPGSINRRPMKVWKDCTDEERLWELMLACSMDDIVELAIMDGLAVPDLEDYLCDKRVMPMKSKRWEDFKLWYAGSEEKPKSEGFVYPTMARVLFAERWEIKMVETDAFVSELMKELNILAASDIATTACDETNAPPSEYPIVQFSFVEDGVSFVKSPIAGAYGDSIKSAEGIQLRCQMFQRAVNILTTARRICASRFLYPPGPARMIHHFMFPPSGGVIFPPMELPPRRFKLFPSTTIDAYTLEEILGWYNDDELDLDDQLMKKAEGKGVKRREYMEWLSHESERVDVSRQMMEVEDESALLRREYWKNVERELELRRAQEIRRQIQTQEEEAEGQPEDAGDMHQVFNGPLPVDIEAAIDSAVEFRYGSGLKNEDELEEILAAQAQVARQAKDQEKLIQNRLKEERIKRERDEAARQRREEQDRRLREGVERRRLLREHFEDIKRMRQQKAYELVMQQQDEILQQQRDRLMIEDQRMEALERDRIRRQEIGEAAQMAAEEQYTRDLAIRRLEIKQFAAEDRLSYRREKHDVRVEIYREKRVRELAEVYETFTPFEFKKERVMLPLLEGILNLNIDTGTHTNDVHNYDFGDAAMVTAYPHRNPDLALAVEPEAQPWYPNNDYPDNETFKAPGSASPTKTFRDPNGLHITIPAKRSIFVLRPMESSVSPFFHKKDLDDPDNPVSSRLQSALATPSEPHVPPDEPLIEDILTYHHTQANSGRLSPHKPKSKQHDRQLLFAQQLEPVVTSEQALTVVAAVQPTRTPRSAKANRRVESDRLREYGDIRLNASASLSALFPLSATTNRPREVVTGVRGIGNLDSSKRKHPLRLQKITLKGITLDQSTGLPDQDEGQVELEALPDPFTVPLSPRTKRLAREGAQAASRYGLERQMVRDYIDGQVAREGDHFFEVCKPGLRTETVLESSDAFKRFYKTLAVPPGPVEVVVPRVGVGVGDGGGDDMSDVSDALANSQNTYSAMRSTDKKITNKKKKTIKVAGVHKDTAVKTAVNTLGPRLGILGQIMPLKNVHPAQRTKAAAALQSQLQMEFGAALLLGDSMLSNTDEGNNSAAVGTVDLENSIAQRSLNDGEFLEASSSVLSGGPTGHSDSISFRVPSLTSLSMKSAAKAAAAAALGIDPDDLDDDAASVDLSYVDPENLHKAYQL